MKEITLSEVDHYLHQGFKEKKKQIQGSDGFLRTYTVLTKRNDILQRLRNFLDSIRLIITSLGCALFMKKTWKDAFSKKTRLIVLENHENKKAKTEAKKETLETKKEKGSNDLVKISAKNLDPNSKSSETKIGLEKLLEVQKEIILGQICGYLKFKDMANLALVKKDFQELIQPELSSFKNFYKAMDLMFEDRSLKKHIQKRLPEEELQKRHKECLEILKKVKKDDLNLTLGYRVGMMGCAATLLTTAIRFITNQERCYETVKLLLELGADPEAEGFYYSPESPLKLAEDNPAIVKLLTDAIAQKKSNT